MTAPRLDQLDATELIDLYNAARSELYMRGIQPRRWDNRRVVSRGEYRRHVKRFGSGGIQAQPQEGGNDGCGTPESNDHPFDLMIALVCQTFGLDQRQLFDGGRQRRFSVPRQVAMYLASDALLMGPSAIGQRFGIDHSTAIHGRDKIDRALRCGSDIGQFLNLAGDIESIRKQLPTNAAQPNRAT